LLCAACDSVANKLNELIKEDVPCFRNIKNICMSKKIMIADDDPGILDAVGIMLEFEGYEVECTPNCDNILSMESEFPDLLLLDIWMSGTDGRDVCRYLKQKESTSKIPIVMISASRDIERSAIDAGADDFLAKPFEMDDLLQKIGRYI
jgi:DNA-binding response OmpR family regulator